MMFRKLTLVSAAVLLSGCGVMPGMQNLELSGMKKAIVPQKIEVNPTLIPITPSLIAEKKINRYHYRVAPADVLSINIWQHPEFDFLDRPSSPALATTAGVQGAAGQPGYLVNADGLIYFPLVGYIKVAGQTVDHIRADISKRLKKYVQDPQINVRVADFRGQKVYVLGEVKKPGFLPINDQPLTIADALTLSGWLDSTAAAPGFTFVIRGDYRHPEIFWLDAKTPDKMLLAERFSLRPGDILFVSSAPATRWNRVLNQLLPTVQTIWYTQSIVRNS